MISLRDAVVIGAGPAGLATALRLRELDLAPRVRVIEQRAERAEGGWGISLDNAAIEVLAGIDAQAAEEVRAALHPWNTVRLRREDEEVTAAGSPLCAITRDRFVRILRDRCAARGVELAYDTALTAEAVRGHAAEADLLVGADGVHSRVRSDIRNGLRAAFGADVSVGANQFIWLAAESDRLDSSMLFRSTPHGHVFAYVYPYAPGTFTFIVECGERMWRRSGLAEMGIAESMGFLQEVFAEDLGGGVLRAGEASWSRFATVRNRHWHHGNVVLVGDAAHTAHFSVGLGTRLALEDAAELTTCLSRHNDLETALGAYERARRKPVEDGQRRAAESQSWFERADRYYRFPIAQFAFSWRARQHTTTFDRLHRMDPGFTARVCQALGDDGSAAEPLLTPCVTVNGRFPNRAVAVLDDELTWLAAADTDTTDEADPITAGVRFARDPFDAADYRTITAAEQVKGEPIELDLRWRPAPDQAESYSAWDQPPRIRSAMVDVADALGRPVIVRIEADGDLAVEPLWEMLAPVAAAPECAGVHLVPVWRSAGAGTALDRVLTLSDLLRNKLGRLTIVSGPWRRDAANTAIGGGRVDLVGLVGLVKGRRP